MSWYQSHESLNKTIKNKRHRGMFGNWDQMHLHLDRNSRPTIYGIHGSWSLDNKGGGRWLLVLVSDYCLRWENVSQIRGKLQGNINDHIG